MLSYLHSYWKPKTEKEQQIRDNFLKLCIKKYKLNIKNKKANIIQKWYKHKIENTCIFIDTTYLLKLRADYYKKISKIDEILMGNMNENTVLLTNELGVTFTSSVQYIKWKLQKQKESLENSYSR